MSCTGEPTLPILYSNIATTTFSALTADLIAPSGTSIAVISNAGGSPGNGAPNGALSFQGGAYGFATANASGLVLSAVGAAGGGNGGVVTLTVDAPSVSVSGTGMAAIWGASIGGTGVAGDPQPIPPDHDNVHGSASGAGGYGAAASVTAAIGTLSITGGATGISLASTGGAGGSVGAGTETAGQNNVVGSAGGAGGNAGMLGGLNAALSLSSVTLNGASGAAVSISATGGDGGDGGMAVSVIGLGQGLATGGAGGAGGNGGAISVMGSLNLSGTTGSGFVGLLAQSRGGAGGDGGAVSGYTGSKGGNGGAGGAGGSVTVGTADSAFLLTASLSGDNAPVLVARSYGGAGGDGGETQNSYGQKGTGGAAAGGGAAGDVSAYLTGNAATAGTGSTALLIQSVGGFSGAGNMSYGAGAQSYGAGGNVTLAATLAPASNAYGLATTGNTSDAILAQSIGGGGGAALQSLNITTLGGADMAGGDAGAVTVTVGGAPIQTSGTFSRGIYADSIGGGGGSGGGNTGITVIGAAGGSGGSGGAVSVTSAVQIVTTGNGSDGLFAASRGGGGGSAMSSAASNCVSSGSGFCIGGGVGGGGGAGGTVSVNFTNGISTSGSDAGGLVAQSIGGGGGDGANSVGTGIVYVQAIGGTGGKGGDGGTVGVTQASGAQGQIVTQGDRSRGLFAQSVGGGGGDGGSAVTVGAIASYTHTVGGSGGAAGDGAAITVDLLVPVSTHGHVADAVFAQSIGGGGGSAGGVIDADMGGLVYFQHNVGGTGGAGGSAGGVSVSTLGAISTTGNQSSGIVAEATGGGGGHSSTVVSNSTLVAANIAVSVGMAGGAGGDVTGTILVNAGGAVTTTGKSSGAIAAHSTGGGGGHAGTVISTGDAQIGEVAVTIGGNGGGGGDGGAVIVTTTGPISTAGGASVGISAISTGGTGGTGALVVEASALSLGNVDVTLGGSGGAGGNSGTVSVTSSGNIITAGGLSDGIFASSAAGFGGDAAFSFASTVAANAASLGDITVTLGGHGGAGGTAGNVTVVNTGSIATAGPLSSGIFAQSLGGGGGRAHGVMAGNVGDVGNVSVTLGGAGGVGGIAGDVLVTSLTTGTTITTGGSSSHGIVAMSIGGAGGSGGFASEVSFNVGTQATGGVSGAVSVAIGGGGAAGGRAGTVEVENASDILTQNFGSIGILAQTVGGNGGTGGSVYAGNLNVSNNGSINVSVDIGGNGGFGSAGNTVGVANSGAITTTGHFAPGISASSTGGDGGNGGSTYVVFTQIGPAAQEKLQVSVGGAGAGGGDAGAVTVSNQGAISTAGGSSEAIFAQSVGGGGGRGGSAGYIGVDLTLPTAHDNDAWNVSLSANVGKGGGGGSGGDAAAVTVTNAGAITTTGTRARGIFAQSVGGGGGDGGTASATSFGLSDICNWGLKGDYICPAAKPGQDGKVPVSVTLSATVQIGGGGGTGGNGAAVTVHNTSAITTAGQLSHGIYAQSVGGGGGNGGEGALGIEAWTTNSVALMVTDLPSNFLPSFTSIDIAVGGTGGGAGKGGAVEVTNSGTIHIQGPDPSYVQKYTGVSGGVTNILPFLAGGAGIFAQSVGGGGGDGGAGSSSLTAIVTLGNTGGGGGDGGTVTVNNSGTIINASGYSGTGIFAQSVGGGGGTAGDVGLAFSDKWDDLNIGVGLAATANGGAGGNGGDVSVTTSGAITTSGTASVGIIAQSVGGAGGITGVSGHSERAFAGSTGAGGNGGTISANVNAPIAVTGTGSVGVVALSTSGIGTGDSSGTVTVNANADIAASGSGGRGILASSASYQNGATGDVLITVAQGASVTTGAAGAETIGVTEGGGNSTITNNGTITSGNAAGYAIRVNTSNTFAIYNFGTINGSVLGSPPDPTSNLGIYNFTNYGLLNSGAEITLAAANSYFQNEGTISPGGLGTLATTAISATLSVNLNANGTYQADFDPSRVLSGTTVASDRLTLATGYGTTPGITYVEGTIAPYVVVSNPGNALRSGTANILQSAQAFDTSLLSVSNSATVQYGLSVRSGVQPGETILALSYVIDTTPWSGPIAATFPTSALGRVNANHDAFGTYMDGLIFQNTAPGAQSFVSSLSGLVLNVPDGNTLLTVYDNYIADEAFAVPDATFLSALMFSNELHSCDRSRAESVVRVGEDGACAWARMYGRVLDTNQDKAGPSYRENMFGMSAGAQFTVAPGTLLGIAGAWETGSVDMDVAGSADVTRYFGGLMLKHDFGAFTLSGSLEGGIYSSNLDRALNGFGAYLIADSDQDGGYVASHARVSRRFDMGTLFLEPVADIGITWLRQNAFTESGAGDFNASLSALNQTTVSVNPFVNFGGTVNLSGYAASLKLRAGVLALFGDDPVLTASLAGTGTFGPSFTIQNSQSNLFADLGAGIGVSLAQDLSLSADVSALLSETQAAYGAQLRLNYRF
ncbi:autotransporter outer membrane beta-barrel domain-containing protein [Aquabacter cavernae]|uniref:autotransporter outer membrane beta-barrel domain-containing protein n=1 Tax=Aquabacter cavernae TaxID=2496029 RepID=UPI000F8F466A|nr:autotransporter outer membrane beta-barrel domain-containing protein [Aquabacter cavernae]